MVCLALMNIGFLYATAAAVTWGIVYAIDQKILSGTPPLTLVFVDAIITALVVLPFLLFDGGSIQSVLVSGKFNWTLIVLSILLATLANYLIFSGIKLVGASSASTIEIAYPFFVVLFSFLFFRTLPNIYFAVGGVLIFIGAAIITYFH